LSLLTLLAFTANPRLLASQATPRHLQYAISFSSQGGTSGLDVVLGFTGDADGVSRIALPSGLTAGAAYPNVTDVRATSPGTILADTDKPQVKRLTYPPGKPVSVAYRVIVTDAGRQMDISYSPEIEHDHFSILGFQIFALPSGSADAPLAIQISWNSLPAGWTLADSYGVGQPRQAFPATPDTLQQSVWAAGDYRLLNTQIRGRSFFLAVRGRWPNSDRQMLAAFSRIIGAERKFWHDDGIAYYLVVLKPSEGDIVGMGFTNSFYEAAPPELGLDFVTENTLAHEAFHAWLPHRITLAAPPGTYAWLYEGFTVYYARLFQLRARLIPAAKYADDCNGVIRAYVSSPFRNISGPQFRHEAEHGFSDYRGQQIVYQRGDLLAQHWNAQIRLASHGRYSLDDVMLDLLHLAQRERRPLPVSDLVGVMRRYTHRDVSGDILRFTEQGATIPPDPAALGPCSSLTPTRTVLFDLGYSSSGSSHQGKITGVETASNAYRAGLRDGQIYIDADFRNGDPAKEAHITVKDQGPQRVISYYPAGRTALIPQYKINPGPLRPMCLSWFGVAPSPAMSKRDDHRSEKTNPYACP